MKRWRFNGESEIPRKWDDKKVEDLKSEGDREKSVTSCESHGEQFECKSVVSAKGGDHLGNGHES